MKFLLKILVTSLAVFFTAYLLKGVHLDGYPAALLVALVLGFLNAFLKPVLVILTIPVTVLTMGLFLLVINALIILLADRILPGFSVDGFWWALLFSIVVSIISGIMHSLAGDSNVNTEKK